MKKIFKVFILMLILNIFMVQSVSASQITLKYDGKVVKTQKQDIKVFMDGDSVKLSSMPAVIVEDSVYLPARDIFECLGGSVIWDDNTGRMAIYNEKGKIAFGLNSNEIEVYGQVKSISAPAKKINGVVMIPAKLIGEVYNYDVKWDSRAKTVNINTPVQLDENGNPIVKDETTQPVPTTNGKKIIVIDAGHGAHDSGATGGGLREKDLNLAMSNAVVAKLQENPNYEVYATRSTDTFLALSERSAFSNNKNADIFSIHVNSASSAATGIETWYTKKQDTRNQKLARLVQNSLVDEFGKKDRGIKSNVFYVTKHTEAPAILIEIGFISNASDRAMMSSADFTERYAAAVAKAVDQYFSVE